MKPNIRIGYGYDVHALKEGHDFWLGGIKIPHTHGAYGHSDADVLIHVICDALLGAANLRDIGFHFPDTDEKYKGIDSKVLLGEVMTIIGGKGYGVVNIDDVRGVYDCSKNPDVINGKKTEDEAPAFARAKGDLMW